MSRSSAEMLLWVGKQNLLYTLPRPRGSCHFCKRESASTLGWASTQLVSSLVVLRYMCLRYSATLPNVGLWSLSQSLHPFRWYLFLLYSPSILFANRSELHAWSTEGILCTCSWRPIIADHHLSPSCHMHGTTFPFAFLSTSAFWLFGCYATQMKHAITLNTLAVETQKSTWLKRASMFANVSRRAVVNYPSQPDC